MAGRNGVKKDVCIVRYRMGSFLRESHQSASQYFVIQWFNWLRKASEFSPEAVRLWTCGLEGPHAMGARMLSVPSTMETCMVLPPCSWTQRNWTLEQLEGIYQIIVIITENKILWRAVKILQKINWFSGMSPLLCRAQYCKWLPCVSESFPSVVGGLKLLLCLMLIILSRLHKVS